MVTVTAKKAKTGPELPNHPPPESPPPPGGPPTEDDVCPLCLGYGMQFEAELLLREHMIGESLGTL